MSKHPGQATQEILASAERGFVDAGFAGTSVQEIMAGMPYSKPTLYSYFQSKEGLLRAVSADTGETVSEIKLEALPTWDGMAAAGGKLFLVTKDGKVRCFGKK